MFYISLEVRSPTAILLFVRVRETVELSPPLSHDLEAAMKE